MARFELQNPEESTSHKAN